MKSHEIDKFVESKIAQKIRTKFSKIAEESFKIHLRELLRFFVISADFEEGIFFPGDELMDQMWHELIVETNLYFHICSNIGRGEYIHHNSIELSEYVELKGKDYVIKEQLRWLVSYNKKFGPLTVESSEILPISQMILERLNLTLVELNGLIEHLGLSDERDSVTSFERFLDEVKNQSFLISREPKCLGYYLERFVDLLDSKQRTLQDITFAELMEIYGVSIPLAFTLSQALAVVTRLESARQDNHILSLEAFSEILSGKMLVGSATTYLAKDKISVSVRNEGENFVLRGTVPWVTGYGIFKKIVLGFICEEVLYFALVEFDSANDEFRINPVEISICNGTSTVNLELNDFLLNKSKVIYSRKLSNKPTPRQDRYSGAEIGVGISIFNECKRLYSSDKKWTFKKEVSELFKKLEMMNKNIEELVLTNKGIPDSIIFEFNHASIDLLFTLMGAQVLLEKCHYGVLIKDINLFGLILQPENEKNRRLRNAISRLTENV